VKLSKKRFKSLVRYYVNESSAKQSMSDAQKNKFKKGYNAGAKKAFMYFSSKSGSRIGKYSKTLDNLAKTYNMSNEEISNFKKVLLNHIQSAKPKFVTARSFQDQSTFHKHGTSFKAYLDVNADQGTKKSFGVFNPTVTIVYEHIIDAANLDNFEENVENLVFHELAHIETRMADYVRKNSKTDDKQVFEKVLKKIMLSYDDMLQKMKKSALTSNKEFYNKIVKRYGEDWKNVFTDYGSPMGLDPRKSLNASDEIRDRLSELKAHPSFTGNLEYALMKAKKSSYDEISKLYSAQIADLIMFIDYENNDIITIISELEKIS
jgi:hypothetical protein